MALTKKQKAARKARKAANNNNNKTVVVAGRAARTLDAPALAYAKLLSDPCNARVVHPVFPGSDAGYLFRADAFSVIGSGALETSGYFHWTPGYVNSNNTEILVASAANSSTGVVATAFAAGPGKTFLAANSRAYRCVAACLKVSFSGAESARAGRIHFGHTAAGMIDVGNTLTADSVAQTLTNYTRTPADMIEIVWKPSLADTEFCDPTEAASAALRDRKSAITFAFSGLPAAVGLTWHATAVYEWQPSTALGVAGNPTGKSDSRNSLDDVIDYTISRGEKFVRFVGGNFMGGAMNYAVGAVSAAFGNMPSMGYQRRLGM